MRRCDTACSMGASWDRTTQDKCTRRFLFFLALKASAQRPHVLLHPIRTAGTCQKQTFVQPASPLLVLLGLEVQQHVGGGGGRLQNGRQGNWRRRFQNTWLIVCCNVSVQSCWWWWGPPAGAGKGAGMQPPARQSACGRMCCTRLDATPCAAQPHSRSLTILRRSSKPCIHLGRELNPPLAACRSRWAAWGSWRAPPPHNQPQPVQCKQK